MNIKSMLLTGVCGFAALTVLFGSWYTINQGDRGVILRNGAVIGEAEPGLGFKLPIVDSVTEISVQSQKAVWDKVPVYSHDQQTAVLRISMNYHVDNVQTVYREYKTADQMIDRLVSPQVPTQAESVFGTYSAAQAVQNRAKLNADIAIAIRKVLKGPYVIESIQVENIDFDDAYERAIKDQMQKVVELRAAESTAAKTKMLADADAYSKKVKGEGEAAAIKARGDALRENPGLPALVTAEKWDGHLPATMVPGGAVPFVKVNP